jgi:SpoVK/Ycf46/Vps4 family AAA+-type ATPase
MESLSSQEVGTVEDNSHITIAEGVVLYPPHVLKNAHDYKAPKYIFGLEKQKKLMDAHILYPLKASNHYVHAHGKHQLQRFLYLYGPRGSGKELYATSFGGKYGVNVVVLDFARFDPLEHLSLVYSTALENQPCIVLYDECEGYFQTNSDRRMVGKLFAELKGVHDSHHLVWTIFLSTVKPIPSQRNPGLCHTILEMLDHYSYCGELTERDRIKVLSQAIASKLYSVDAFPLNDVSLRQLANAAIHCTPKQIHSFVERVFNAKITRLNVSSLAATDPKEINLVPNIQDFKDQLYDVDGKTPPRITLTDPYEINIVPYTEAPRNIPYGFS